MFKNMFKRLKKRLNKKRVRRLRRNLRKGQFDATYVISNDITQFGQILHTLGARNNELEDAKIYHGANKYSSKGVPNRPPLNVQIALIDNPIVVSKTDGFIDGKNLYHPDLLRHVEHRHDVKNQTFKLNFNNNFFTASLPKGISAPKKIPGLVISLIKEHSHNYYHFIFEILPKLLHISETVIDGLTTECDENLSVTILLDAGVPLQCQEYIQQLAGFPYVVERLEYFEMACCEQLICCTPFFHALDNTRIQNFDVDDFYVDRYAVELVQRSCSLLSGVVGEPQKMLYLDRSSNQFRKIVNGDEVGKLLFEYGFESVYPGSYSLEDQIRMFRNAKCVVGSSGAAFANIIHMQPGTCAIIFTPDLALTNYYLFQQQADAAKVNLIHINTINSQKVITLHDDAYVSIMALDALLGSLYEKIDNKGNLSSANVSALELS